MRKRLNSGGKFHDIWRSCYDIGGKILVFEKGHEEYMPHPKDPYWKE